MAIINDEDGFKTLSIPATDENENKKLPTAKDYFLSLNEESYATSDINSWGGITDHKKYDGCFVENKPNEFGVILGHEFNPFIYRGENQKFKRFLPTAKRYSLDCKTQQIKHCIDWIKKQEFIQIFQRAPYFERCQNFQVLNCKFKFDLEAIAQHYEFMSNYIDITKDLFIALFFAYTYKKDNQYLPISDFEKYSPTLYIGNLKKIYQHNPNCLKIIGFQALLRPHIQKAMAIEIKEKDIVKPLFEKIELPKNYAFACDVYDKASRGEYLLPNEIVGNLAIQIKQSKTLDLEFLQEYCNLYKCNIEEITSKLKKKDFELTNKKWDIPNNVRYAINIELDKYIIPYINDKIAFRGVSESLYPKINIEGVL